MASLMAKIISQLIGCAFSSAVNSTTEYTPLTPQEKELLEFKRQLRTQYLKLIVEYDLGPEILKHRYLFIEPVKILVPLIKQYEYFKFGMVNMKKTGIRTQIQFDKFLSREAAHACGEYQRNNQPNNRRN
jgi:hypothetical protein